MSKKLAKNIGLMSIAVFLSRILGLVRDQIFAFYFGSSKVADAFNLAFTIPNLLRRLFGEGALGAALIPIYQKIGVEKGTKKQVAFGANVLAVLSFFLGILCVIGILGAPYIVKLLAPGFDSQTFNLAVKLTKILLPYLFLIGVSSTIIAILNSHDYYFLPGLSSAFLNIGMILAVVVPGFLLAKNANNLIVCLSFGVLIGGILQIIVNFPLLKACGYNFKISLQQSKSNLKQLWFKFLPGVWGIAVRQINLVVDKNLASRLISGSISALNYGNRLMQLPLGMFGVAVGTATVPAFSKLVAKKEYNKLSNQLSFAIKVLALILLPVTAIILANGKDIIKLIFMRGAFNSLSLEMSYSAFAYYSAGLVFYGINRTLTGVFYAFGNTKTPFKISFYIVGLNVVLNLGFIKLFKLMGLYAHGGLALATSISAAINMLVLLILIKKMYNNVKAEKCFIPILKIALISSILGILAYWLGLIWVCTSIWLLIIKLATICILFLAFYIALAKMFKINEINYIVNKLWNRIKK